MSAFYTMASGTYTNKDNVPKLEDDLDVQTIVSIRRHLPEEDVTQSPAAYVYVCFRTKDNKIVIPSSVSNKSSEQATGSWNLFGEGIPYTIIQLTNGSVFDPEQS